MHTELIVALVGGVLAGLLLIGLLVWYVGAARTRYRNVLIATTVMTFIVVVAGAYVRLSDAGLGCPDWPGCYGHLDVPKTTLEREVADATYPNAPVDIAKGWKEMGHRYIAGVLGFLIVAIAVVAMRRGATLQQSWRLPIAIVALVIFQAALGRWTVTLLLKPVIVTLHLIGGMTILALLTWLTARQWLPERAPMPPPVPRALAAPSLVTSNLRVLSVVMLGLIAAQIILGGWVSTNYAALACPDLPLCRGAVIPPMDFANAFHVLRELGQTAAGELLSNEALTAIHWMHRKGALIVSAFAIFFAWRLARVPGMRGSAVALLGALAVQFMIGLLNVVYSLPLVLAAAHNAGAALLLIVIVVINFRLFVSVRSERAVESFVGVRSSLS